MKELLTFNDVVIVPKFSTIKSRKDVSLKTQSWHKSFCGIYADLPVVSANMDTITDTSMAWSMLKYGAQACLHRFQSIDENVDMLNRCNASTGLRSPWVSIGLGKEELDRACALYDNNAIVFVIDVAHGAQMAVAEQAKELKSIIKGNGSILVGNFATAKSVMDFYENVDFDTVDGFKIGIGPGAACTTRVKTGVGYPQLSAIKEIAHALKKYGAMIVADGGMKTSGDIAKAIGAGAHIAMLGSMLSGTEETPGEKWYTARDSYSGQDVTISEKALLVDPTKYIIKKEFKKYRGSASKESYQVQGKSGAHMTDEGESFLVPFKGSVNNVLQDIEGGLRSSFSYVGARNMKEFHEKVEFVRVTQAGYVEGTPHGKDPK